MRGVLSPLVLLGRASDERAELLVADRHGVATGPETRLEGRLTGPRCGQATMLPTEITLEPLPTPPGREAMARAVLTEPAYWHPELPALYRLEARLFHGGREVAGCDTIVGLRRGGVRGRSLWLEGRRYVPRAVRVHAIDGATAPALRRAGLAAWLDDPDEPSCEAAAREGIAIVAGTGARDDPASLAERVVDIAICPAVVLVVVPAAVPDRVAEAALSLVGRRRGTLPVARAVDGTAPPPATLVRSFDCLVASLTEDGDPHEGWRCAAAPPAIAARTVAIASPLESARGRCDRLQRALADWARRSPDADAPEWAGYLVG